MYKYALQLPNKAAAQQLANIFQVEWDGIQTHITKQDENGRMDVTIFADIQERNPDKSPKFEADGETPKMLGKYHVEVLSTYEIDHPAADNFLVDPRQGYHEYLGITDYQMAPRFR